MSYPSSSKCVANEWRLCRARHKRHYAESRTMPSQWFKHAINQPFFFSKLGIIFMSFPMKTYSKEKTLWGAEPIPAIYRNERAWLVKIALFHSNVPKVIICFLVYILAGYNYFNRRMQGQANRSIRNRFRTPISIDCRLPAVSLCDWIYW